VIICHALKGFFVSNSKFILKGVLTMISYENCLIYGVTESDLPIKGFLRLTGNTGRRNIYQFSPASEGRWLYVWSGAIEIISNGQIIFEAYYYDRHEKFEDTIFLLEDGGIFDPLIDRTFYYQINKEGKLVRVNP
jgi:hypothetical protein